MNSSPSLRLKHSLASGEIPSGNNGGQAVPLFDSEFTVADGRGWGPSSTDLANLSKLHVLVPPRQCIGKTLQCLEELTVMSHCTGVLA